jgi:hypothetical protein
MHLARIETTQRLEKTTVGEKNDDDEDTLNKCSRVHVPTMLAYNIMLNIATTNFLISTSSGR